jgi:hypothetical protein
MRKVQGLQLLLFDENDWRNDDKYTGGDVKPPSSLVETSQRSSARVKGNEQQSIIVKMSNSGIDQLRAGQPQAYARLMNLMREAYREEKGKIDVITVKLSKKDVEELQKNDPNKLKRLIDIVDTVIERKKMSPPPPPHPLPPPSPPITRAMAKRRLATRFPVMLHG